MNSDDERPGMKKGGGWKPSPRTEKGKRGLKQGVFKPHDKAVRCSCS
jgi:hypothetical protein